MVDWKLEQLAPDRLIWRNKVRSDAGDLAALAWTMKRRGVLNPLLAHREDSDLVGDDGWRRSQAAAIAGLATLPVIVTERALTEAEAIEVQLITAIHRQGLNPMEKSRGLDALMRATGSTAADAATRIGVSPSMASKLLLLQLLTPELQKQVEEGTLGLSTAYEIAKVSDGSERARLTAEAARGGLTRARVTARVKSLTKKVRRRKFDSARCPRVTFRLGQGRSIVVSGPQLSVEVLVNWIGELFATLTSANAGGLTLDQVISSLSEKGDSSCQQSSSG